jgi:hypothetical protein
VGEQYINGISCRGVGDKDRYMKGGIPKKKKKRRIITLAREEKC